MNTFNKNIDWAQVWVFTRIIGVVSGIIFFSFNFYITSVEVSSRTDILEQMDMEQDIKIRNLEEEIKLLKLELKYINKEGDN